ncbi:non-hydrolyzing UDP-N-acetylglucosamine 2-epimerase [Oleiagrimonas soli]|uniref:UDP-N-acetylglucosamine 2-epimerase (non-hydrolyzing) n=1 Tax=Oleiagrimonas soli TaxID=1543381 RepID=A0A099CXR1_9GAMM|nr:UDP-N-acetylglucosamine 2-epimerase (non-hydrolyzing) [Oleiagrimonas soli]KGI78504.1 UDP-N-acetylglucosamine 2-epimerase [Oleiagrimonas soli]MBB6184237.1 UDP-N-acetylglucosamine 2-epimerase (non-hydrolyzing) [Oleiagrimonas soli]
MNEKKHLLCIVGTRPEGIKMAPVIKALKQASWARVTVLATAQHRDLLDQVLSLFDIRPDMDLNIMKDNQSLSELTSRLLTRLDEAFAELRPDIVLAQGDTTTVMTAALAAFYRRIPFGHVEAGLRTHDMANPFPEEMNRLVAGHLARWHFVPTQRSRANLLREGIDERAIHVTGNTVIDALLEIAEKEWPLDVPLDDARRLVLVTAHRRENFGAPLREICKAILRLVDHHEDIEVLYPVHPNPNVRAVVAELLSGHSRIHLVDPLEYAPFVEAQKRAHLILTDSGGVQEEAPALGKPVLVMRVETERPEAVEEGVVRLVGTDEDEIFTQASRLLSDAQAHAAMARGVSPYGDGHAASRIADILERDLAGADGVVVGSV